jgi:hypothetical protein
MDERSTEARRKSGPIETARQDQPNVLEIIVSSRLGIPTPKGGVRIGGLDLLQPALTHVIGKIRVFRGQVDALVSLVVRPIRGCG